MQSRPDAKEFTDETLASGRRRQNGGEFIYASRGTHLFLCGRITRTADRRVASARRLRFRTTFQFAQEGTSGLFARVLKLTPIFEQKSCYICTVQARHEQLFGDARPDGRLQTLFLEVKKSQHDERRRHGM